MKKLSIFLFAIFFVSMAHGRGFVKVGLQEVFIPTGFDDNDETIAVIDGYLPDPCHTITKTSVHKDPVSRKFFIEQWARQEGEYCPDVTVPFTKVVSLGQLRKGRYSVVANKGKIREKLIVKKATKSLPDDYMYAPVDGVSVRVDGKDDVIAILEGRLTTRCLSMDRVDTYKTGKTIQVLPIMKLEVEPEGNCPFDERFFKVEVPLPKLKNRRYLLHVRSLNGQSKNLVFNPYINE